MPERLCPDRAVRLAKEQRAEVTESVRAKLATVFAQSYAGAADELASAIDAAMEANVRVRDLHNRARGVLKDQAPSDIHYSGLVPATPTFHSRYADWRTQFDNWRQQQGA